MFTGFSGGAAGIRTLVPVKANGFQAFFSTVRCCYLLHFPWYLRAPKAFICKYFAYIRFLQTIESEKMKLCSVFIDNSSQIIHTRRTIWTLKTSTGIKSRKHYLWSNSASSFTSAKESQKKLLDTEIPCVIQAKTTHKYTVYKQDLINYLGAHPGAHFPRVTTRTRYSNTRLFPSAIPELFKKRMAFYLTSEFVDRPELIRIRDVAEMIGYGKEQVGEWANEGLIQYVTISNIRYVSKSNLIHFLCTEDFDSVCRKSKWHKQHIEIFREWKKSWEYNCYSHRALITRKTRLFKSRSFSWKQERLFIISLWLFFNW